MTAPLIFTCPSCRSIVDYGCMCEPPPSHPWTGHASVAEAKAAVEQMRKGSRQ